MIKGKNRSVVKTLRISKELDDYLKIEADKSKQTVSALVLSIFTLYRDRYSQFDRLQPVALPPATMMPMIEHISDEDLRKLGAIEASRLFTYTEYVLNQKDPQDRITYCLMDLLPTSQWFTCIRSKDAYMITHNMDERWTVFLSSLLSTLFELDTGAKPSIQSDGNLIILNHSEKKG